MVRLSLFIAALALSACASDPAVLSKAGPAQVPDRLVFSAETDAQPIDLSDGSKGWAVTGETERAAEVRAEALCPTGYEVHGKDALPASRTIAMVDKLTPRFAHKSVYKLFISCTDGAS